MNVLMEMACVERMNTATIQLAITRAFATLDIMDLLVQVFLISILNIEKKILTK